MTEHEKIQETLDSMKLKIQAMEEQLNKPKEFKWEYPRSKTHYINSFQAGKGYTANDNDYLEHGRYRKSKEVAEQALDLNKRVNRLHAICEQLDGLKEYKANSRNYYIYVVDEWSYATTAIYTPETIYMTESCATEVCRMLNGGEFML